MSELRRYLSVFRPHAVAIAGAAAFLSVAAAIPGATVVVLQVAFDRVLLGGESALLAPVCAALAGLALARAAVTLIRTAITKRVAWRVTSELRRDLHDRYLRSADADPLGSRLAALTHEVDELQYGVSALVTALRNPLTVAGLAIPAVWMAPRLAPWALVLVPAVVVAARWAAGRVRARSREVREARAALSALAADQLGARDAIRDAGATDDERARFATADERDRSARLALEIERVLPSAITQVVVMAAAAVLLWVGGRQVLAGTLEPGQLIGFAAALGLMHRPLAGLSEVWSLWQRSLAALERVHEALDRPVPSEPSEPLPRPEPGRALIVEGLVAGWSDPVLHGVDLIVEPGEVVALVGPSGAGKSTLLAAVQGALTPTSGGIRYGDTPLERLLSRDRRAIVGIVPQKPALLDRTVRENVALGQPDATDAEILDALERAGAGFAALDAPVGEGGGLLSGGERQRICLARALLSDPAVLLLDEATNQVDPATERAILADLRRSSPDRTVLMVAHDPATAALADRVVRLDSEGIVRAASPQRVA